MRRNPSLVRAATTLALLALVLVPLSSTLFPASPLSTSAASVAIALDDPFLAPPRGTPEKVIRYAEAKGATRPLDTRRYIEEIYRLAPLVGLDPALVVAQSDLETASWTSFYWTNHLNPAGIRITSSGVPSYTWSTGTAAARYHLVHLYIYVAGAIDPGNPLYPYRTDGPGYQGALSLGYGGQHHVLDDLTGHWAVDPLYGTKIVSRGNAIFAASPDDPTDPRVTSVASQGSQGGTARYATDGDPGTTWSVAGTGGAPPAGASLTVDLGRSHRLDSVRWVFGVTGRADSWRLQISPNGTSWTDLATYSNARSRVWQVHPGAGRTARYVRFLFANPNGDAKLGGFAEVEVYGRRTNGSPPPTATPYPIPTATRTPIPTATRTPTVTPSPTPDLSATASPVALAGDPQPIAGGGGSGTGTWSGFVRDGDIATTWRTATTPAPAKASVYVDLGLVRPITGVEWMFRRTSGAASYAIQVSTDLRIWTTISTHAGSTPLAWQRVAADREARYVRFLFANPTNAPALGYLAEIRVYGVAAAGEVQDATPTEIATLGPEPTPSATATPAESPSPAPPPPTATAEPSPPDTASPIASPPGADTT